MENDLTIFEKYLLKCVNANHGTNYNYKHLMEWDTNKEIVEKNLQEGEIMYQALGCFVVINPNK